MIELITLELLLDPLSASDKAALENQPLILGTGVDQRMMLTCHPSYLTVEQKPPPEISRHSDGSAFVPISAPRPLTWKITAGGAHGAIVTTVFELMWTALQSATATGGAGTTRLWDYSRPNPPVAYTEFNVALLMDFEYPQDGMHGDALRYIQGPTLALREV
ncbi:MAG: hypothetical protein F6J87_06080 [Spirulina sp. SIO3F2]|nr:hypothetical protein [Spirulina sp. SIO3F2]